MTSDIYEYPRKFYWRVISKRVGSPKRIQGVKGPSEILEKYVEMKLSLHQAVGYHVSFTTLRR
jgi:hypothetical protein